MAASYLQFLQPRTPYFFFTGKGGVGKTSLACATAVALAESGARVLLISTDPASNLSEVLETPLSTQPTPIPQVPNLQALDLDPEAAARAYREKVVGPYRDLLPPAAVAAMEEQLSGACTMEIATFDEFARFLGDADFTRQFDHLVFDTAPTGHTLRLLALPKAWTHFFSENTTGNSCLGPLAGLQQQRTIYEAALAALSDSTRTSLVLVTRPEEGSLQEAARSASELREIGLTGHRLILNGRFKASDPEDAIARAYQSRADSALRRNAAFLEAQPVHEIPLQPSNMVGIAALRQLVAPAATLLELPPSSFSSETGATFSELIDQLETEGRGLVMTMGKGGVGKTTMAAAIAVELASRGHAVHLSTTDPAAHLQQALPERLAELEVSRIDPTEETQAYVEEVLATQGADLEERGRDLLLEDLRSPCTEEIAVFRAFARTVAMAEDRFVILDTAPTGHTLLLLDATEAYHRELGRQSGGDSDPIRQLLPRLRDPDFTRIILVTLAEPTPVHEAAMLADDLERAGIHPHSWIINQALSPLTLTDPVLVARARHEAQFLHAVAEKADFHTLVPWQATPPTGVEALRQMTHTTITQIAP